MATSCSPELTPPDARQTPELTFEPAAEPDAVTPVVRVNVAAWTDPATLRLFRDELSAYHVGRVRSGELPKTLLEREVPTLAFAGPGRASSMPLEVLAPGVYSLASADLGLIGSFTVAGSEMPILSRLWPPEQVAGDVGVYCGDGGIAQPLDVALEPLAIAARVTPGASSSGLLADRCLRLEAAESLAPGMIALPPPLVGGVLLEPRPLVAAGEPADLPADCVAPEIELGGACASVFDDRVALRANQPLLLVFDEPSPALVVLESAGARQVVQGLPPDTELWLSGESLSAAGQVQSFRTAITTLPAVGRVVINELLSNPLGSEPAQEWIELVNDGSAAVELGGYRLEDGGGSVTLPARLLAPGAFVVLASADYVPDPALDVVPADPSVLLRLPLLAKSGLSNSGEPLRLFDAAGNLVSRFPALKAGTGGVSLARRAPASPDDDPAAFGPHAPPGASPGAPNTLAN